MKKYLLPLVVLLILTVGVSVYRLNQADGRATGSDFTMSDGGELSLLTAGFGPSNAEQDAAEKEGAAEESETAAADSAGTGVAGGTVKGGSGSKTAADFAAKAKAVAEAAYAEAEAAAVMSKIATNADGDDKAWRFLAQELRHVGQGQFWTSGFSEAASGKDPRPVIQAYHDALKARGVRLIVVPVPPKAFIYPQEFWSEAGDVFTTADFYKPLEAAGVEVIDLEPVLRAERVKEGGEKLYCEQDSHPTPYTCKLIAELIAKQLGEPVGVGFEISEPKEVSIKGDLSAGDKEKVKVWTVSKDGEAVQPDDKSSPVVVVGDSHTLVFQAGGSAMLMTQAGMVDHLQAKLGYPVYRFANEGSGVDAARGNLARAASQNPDFWKGKKAVIWCFGARMFTQERQWRELPVGRPLPK